MQTFSPHSHFFTQRFAGWTVAVLAAVLTVAIYFPGLHGPFLLDDVGNLEPVQRWLEGNLNWRAVVFDGRAGPGGRPVSMLSFLADAAISGDMSSSVFKLTNLVIHLLTGYLAFILARQILRRVTPNELMASRAAALIALAWLWMPIQASTTLYVVQRMAQLASLLTFAALSTYLLARGAIIAGRRWGVPLLWIGPPLLTVLAALAKENGALALPLAAVLEFTLFRSSERPRSVRWFLALTVGLPIASALAFLLARFDVITRGYASRDFTLSERLLTEPRILWSYLQTSFFPVGPRMGLYHDNYPISFGLLSPWSTIASIAAWVVVVVYAFVLRRRTPLILVGVMGYLIGLSLESGPISLELYFEHRNYGPLFFALLAAAGISQHLIQGNVVKPSVRRLLGICVYLILATYAFGTWNQARTWADERTFNAVQYAYNPTSPRLLSSLTARAMLDHDLSGALHYIDAGELNSPPSERATATLWRLTAYCEAAPDNNIPTSLYDELDARAHGRINTYAMVAWDILAGRLAQGCGSVNRSRITEAGIRWLTKTTQSPREQFIWRTRYNIGRIIADDGHLELAREVVEQAWKDSDRNNGIGVLLFQLNASLGDADGCREVLAALEKNNTGSDKQLDRAVKTFRTAMASGQIGKHDG